MKLQHEDKVRKGSHCAWQIHYHIVFPVKYRKALLDEEATRIIKETAASIEERYPIEMEALGTGKNHIHVLCSAHPKVAPGRIVQIFKSITARELFRRPAIKRDLWGGEFWSDGYYVATVGERANWQMVERYVQQQGNPKEDVQQLKLFYLFDTPSACCGVLHCLVNIYWVLGKESFILLAHAILRSEENTNRGVRN